MRNWLYNFLYSEEDNDPGFVRVVRTVLMISLVGAILVLAALILTNPDTQITTTLALSTIIVFSAIALILSGRNVLWPGKILMPLLLSIAIPFIATNANGLRDSAMIAFPFIVVTASLLIGRHAITPFTIMALIGILVVAFRDMTGLRTRIIPAKPGLDDVAVYILIMTFIASALSALFSRLYQALQRSRQNEAEQIKANTELRQLQLTLETRIAERTLELNISNQRNENRARQFEAIALVARSISSTQNFDILLPQITDVISREFGFYHAGIFLLDERKEYAVFSASNSEGGQRMLERNHRLRVGETGIVGYVASTGKARVALDTGADAVFFDNPDLPGTKSEIALPLRIGDEIIGALDVQSTEPDAFDQEDINVLDILADQVSIAIQNARQYEATRKALIESESLSRQFVQTGWQQFIKNQNLIGIRHSGAKATLLYGKNNTDIDDGTGTSHRNQPRAKARGATLTLPIKLRGEMIGMVDVRSPVNRQLDQDELDIVTAIIERAAIAMENARLLAESQRRAAKEQKIGEMTARISASINMRNVLQTAVEELGRALPGSEVVIQFNEADGEKKR